MSGDIPGVGRCTPTEALGVSTRRLDKGAITADSTCEDIPPIRGDLAGEWLRENDPRLLVEGIAAEVESDLTSEGLTLDEAKSAFKKSGGCPSKAHAAFRARVRRALQPMWDDDRRRDHMAHVLGCDRKTLRRLMG